MPAFHHGITAQELAQGIMPMRNANVSVIGLVCVSSDADADMYPLNVPVLLTGITQDNLDKAGADGTLFNCLQTIRDIHNPTVVILRVEEDFDPNILNVLLECPTRFGLMPKRLGAPEIDTPEVVLKLVSIAKDRRAIVYASPRKIDGSLITDKAEIVTYRDTFGDRELCLIDGEWGVPGKSNNGSVDDVIIPSEVNFDDLPSVPGVVINNDPNNSFGAYFAIEINGIIYNADKSKDITTTDEPWQDLVDFYSEQNNDIAATALIGTEQRVRLIPSNAQRLVSTQFVTGVEPWYGTGAIGTDGSFYFKISAAE